jgi:LysM repeat protein
MTPNQILAPSFIALVLASCAPQKADPYDTPASPYGTADYGQPTADTNPVYDTPAAYEETGVTPSAQVPPSPYTSPYAAVQPTAPAAPAAPSNGAAIIHTVVAGDTLSGISSKYKVPTAAIKQANNMTKDIVVLGRKMVIPPVN